MTTATAPRKATRKTAGKPVDQAPAAQTTQEVDAAPADPRFYFFLIAFILENGEISSMPAYFDSPNLSRMALERVRGSIITQHGRNAVITGVSPLGLMSIADFEGQAQPLAAG